MTDMSFNKEWKTDVVVIDDRTMILGFRWVEDKGVVGFRAWEMPMDVAEAFKFKNMDFFKDRIDMIQGIIRNNIQEIGEGSIITGDPGAWRGIHFKNCSNLINDCNDCLDEIMMLKMVQCHILANR